jgi:hypothetical protein
MNKVMEANEAPEKIYVHVKKGRTLNTWNSEWIGVNDIEYVHIDAFIEKAWDWIEDNLLSSNQQDKSRLYFEQFKNYMKGE